MVEEEQLSQLDVLLRQADGAMLAAKRAGKGRVVWLSADGETAPVARQAQLRRRLQLAVAAGGFRLHYQPLLDLATDGSLAVEALLRWHDEVLGSVPPSEFIPVAESVNLIQQIGRWVFNEACAQAGAWLEAGSPRTISINVSPIQLAANKVVGELLAAMAAHRVPAELIRWRSPRCRDRGLPPRDQTAGPARRPASASIWTTSAPGTPPWECCATCR